MPATINELLEDAGLELTGAVSWGKQIESGKKGIYIASLSASEASNACCLERAPIERALVQAWLDYVPQLTLDRQSNVSADRLAQRLKRFWFADETVLYIGETAQPLASRLDDYYRTKLGDPGPHSGGHWIMTLSPAVMDLVRIYYAETDDHEAAELRLLDSFAARTSEVSRARLRDRNRVLPFANRRRARGENKEHGIGHATRRPSHSR
jgi:hypothetical protein